MSNLLFNIRFRTWFFQVTRGSFRTTFCRSTYWKIYYATTRDNPKAKWVQVYTAFGRQVDSYE